MEASMEEPWDHMSDSEKLEYLKLNAENMEEQLGAIRNNVALLIGRVDALEQAAKA
jgi:phage shock protein A